MYNGGSVGVEKLVSTVVLYTKSNGSLSIFVCSTPVGPNICCFCKSEQ